MGKFLAYYAKENAQYKDAGNVRVTEEVVQLVLPQIFKHFGQTNCFFKVNPRKKNWSYYRPGNGLRSPRHGMSWRQEEIVMAPSMMNWRVIAHEAAHALHCRDYSARYNLAQTHNKVEPKERWHGSEHRDWMKRVIDFLVSIDVLKANIPTTAQTPTGEELTEGMKGKIQVWNRGLVRIAMDAMPATMICPRCLMTRTKEQFGVRITKKTHMGFAKKVARQSYCQPCR